MPDWTKIVREKLGHLPFDDGRREEVIGELAQQLESAYEEAISAGASESEAMRRSLAQFSDWEKLRREVFRSVAGTQLPVWEQKGFFAPRRLPVWITLAVALAFLALPSFRKALDVLPLSGQADAWDATAFSAEALLRMERTGDKQEYARTLAYVALHSPDPHQAVLAAEKAIALDPQLTWICASMSHATYFVPGYDPKPWIDRLEAWDPDNTFVYVLEADAVVYHESAWGTRWSKFNAANRELERALVAEPRWRLPMEKAFSAPRAESYMDRHFLLDREVLLERGLDRPVMLTLAVSTFQRPDFFMLETYANHLLEVGEGEERAGHRENALAAYQSIASFGEKLQTGAPFEHAFSMKFQEDAYQKMIPLLRSAGRGLEAGVVRSALAAVRAEIPDKYGPSRGGLQSPAFRSGQMVFVSGLILILFTVAAALWLVCIALLAAKPSLRPMNGLASCLGFAPALLPLSCLALFLSFLPYARSIREYSAAEQLLETYGAFFAGVTSLRFDPILDAWIDHMFWPLIWCAAILIFGAMGLRYLAWRRPADPSGVE